MTDGPTPHALSERLARLEERMKTMQAEYKTDIALLAKAMAEYKTDIALLAKTIAEDNAKRDTEAAKRDKDYLTEAAKRDKDYLTEAAKRDTEAAKRDKDNLRWQVGLWIAAVVVLGFIIRLSAD